MDILRSEIFRGGMYEKLSYHQQQFPETWIFAPCRRECLSLLSSCNAL
jgi:hypothetical protein